MPGGIEASGCRSPIVAAQSHPELLAELAGMAESSIFAPLRRFEMDPVPIGTWPIASDELDVDTGLGLLMTVASHFDIEAIEDAWPEAGAALSVLNDAGFSPDAVRLARIMGLDLLSPIVILLAAKAHSHIQNVAIWLKVDIDRVPISIPALEYM
jgi:hypothetical protein